MMSKLVRIIAVLVLIAHGLGHTLGLFPPFGLGKAASWSDQSWLFTSLLGEALTRWIGVIIWLLATVGFVIGGLGLLGTPTPLPWWRSLALAAALISLAGIVLYPQAFPGLLNTVGALVVDVVVLVALFWLHWPATQLAGS
jgi:hypothetical protein